MKPRILAGSSAILPLAFLTSCGLFGSDPAGPSQVGDLVSWVERVYVEAEVSKDRARAAFDKLQAIASSEFDADAVTAYAEFVTAIERSEAQAETLGSVLGPMKAAADPVFDQWNTAIDGITSSQLRERSEARLMHTRERYDTIVQNIEPAHKAYTELNLGLRDHALFLANDFNAHSLAAIQDGVRSLGRLAAELDGRLDATLEASRGYIELASLPMSASNVAAPPGGGVRDADPRGAR